MAPRGMSRSTRARVLLQHGTRIGDRRAKLFDPPPAAELLEAPSISRVASPTAETMPQNFSFSVVVFLPSDLDRVYPEDALRGGRRRCRPAEVSVLDEATVGGNS